jgi:hypothetical protein
MSIVCHICGGSGPDFNSSTEEALEAWNRRTPVWISVADELPDDDIAVLIANPAWDEPIGSGYHHNCTWRRLEAAATYVIEPTHWMHLPEPPKESEVAK